MAENTVFGYESLTLPTSLVSRFVDLEEADPVYEQEPDLSDEGFFGYGSLISPSVVGGYFTDNAADKINQKFESLNGSENPQEMLREEFVENWRESEVEIIPVKAYGFERRYNMKSDRGGLMLSARENPDKWINGVVITNLPEEQKKKIRQVENDYREVRIDHDDLEVYESCDIELPDQITVFVEQPDLDKFESDVSDQEINQVYNKTILGGIDLLGEIYGEELAENFRQDYLETTTFLGDPLSELE